MKIQLTATGIQAVTDESNLIGSIRVSELGFSLHDADGVEKIRLGFDGELQVANNTVTVGADGSISTPNATIYADGSFNFPGGTFNADGSGHLAGGNIVWDAEGNLNAKTIS